MKPVEIVSGTAYAVIIPIIRRCCSYLFRKDDEVRNPLTLITSIITATVVILIIQRYLQVISCLAKAGGICQD